MGGRRWTSYEVKYLEKKSSLCSTQYIAKRLKRSKISVERKRQKLGILSYSKSNSTYISANQLGIILGKSPTTVRNWIKKYNDFPIKSNDRKNIDSRYIIFEDILPWLKNHQELFFADKVSLYSLGFEPNWLNEKRKSDVLKRKNQRKKAKPYTIKECQMILKYKDCGATYQEIAKIFNRSESSLKAKIFQLKKDGFLTDFNNNFIAK